jgi:hypothetical protein
MPEWASRVTAAGYGVAAALTLDEFALWLDLHDDYWDKQGRKSIDAVALFGGMLTIGVAGRDMINDLGLFPKRIGALVERDEARRAALAGPPRPDAARSYSGGAAGDAGAPARGWARSQSRTSPACASGGKIG